MFLCALSAVCGYGAETPADVAREDSFFAQNIGNTVEHSPLNDSYQLWGWGVISYYYYLYLHFFADYPWVIRVAYFVIIMCCLGFISLLFFMGADVYLRTRKSKTLAKIKELYLEKLKGVCYAEVENLSIEEISRRLDYKDRNWKEWEYPLWALVFIEVTLYTNTQNPNLTNIQRAMKLVGFTDHVEKKLIHGRRKTKLRIMEAVRLTNMQLPNSIVTRLVNDKYVLLRRSSRMYYMFTTKDDPYAFFEEGNVMDVMCTTWYKMELHEIFRKIHDSGRATPLFVPIIQKMDNQGLVAFMMQEIAYWGTDEDVRFLFNYFDSPNFMYRHASFICMGIRRFKDAEDIMHKIFYKQTELLRRSILNAVLAIRSGRSVPFFVDAFNNSVSDYTRRTALRCLWLYGDEGRGEFCRLRSKAQENEQILFKHVENPIINDDEL